MNFRKLRANEIDVRAAQVKESGASLLLYKDARVDQRILDETVGAFDWKRSHQIIGDNLYCTVEIYDPDKGEWVAKQDVGTESFTEAEKGQASDSFKRACFNWGIGRELYSAPFIWVGSDKIQIAKSPKGKLYIKGFEPKVAEISYDDDGNISTLRITNRGVEVYSLGNLSRQTARKNDKSDDQIYDEASDHLAMIDDVASVRSYANELNHKYTVSPALKKQLGGLFRARIEELDNAR